VKLGASGLALPIDRIADAMQRAAAAEAEPW
jgi:hypothetical protein